MRNALLILVASILITIVIGYMFKHMSTPPVIEDAAIHSQSTSPQPVIYDRDMKG